MSLLVFIFALSSNVFASTPQTVVKAQGLGNTPKASVASVPQTASPAANPSQLPTEIKSYITNFDSIKFRVKQSLSQSYSGNSDIDPNTPFQKLYDSFLEPKVKNNQMPVEYKLGGYTFFGPLTSVMTNVEVEKKLMVGRGRTLFNLFFVGMTKPIQPTTPFQKISGRTTNFQYVCDSQSSGFSPSNPSIQYALYADKDDKGGLAFMIVGFTLKPTIMSVSQKTLKNTNNGKDIENFFSNCSSQIQSYISTKSAKQQNPSKK